MDFLSAHPWKLQDAYCLGSVASFCGEDAGDNVGVWDTKTGQSLRVLHLGA